MTDFTFDENLFSDFHKEVYGFRPRGHEFYTASDERKQVLWDILMRDHEIEMERYYEEMEEEKRHQEMAFDAWSYMTGDNQDDPDDYEEWDK